MQEIIEKEDKMKTEQRERVNFIFKYNNSLGY